MKCISKKKLIISAVTCSLLFITGCAGQEAELEQAYNIYQTSAKYGLTSDNASEKYGFFAQNLVVEDDENVGLEQTTEWIAEGAGVFLPNSKKATYKKNIHKRFYPASTTKILTAYLALEHCDLDEIVTVSAHAVDQPEDSSVCHLEEGDRISMRDLLYGLMMRSGNDAAIAIAEHISGSEEEFAVLMNAELQKIGATNTHFVTPNGMHNKNHYTTVYDMYLIMAEAIKNEEFVKILGTKDYTASYTSKDGILVTKEWTTTNKYQTGSEKMPDGVTVIGGKTGTTGNAKYCLVQYNVNQSGAPVISIVFKADCRDNMYLLMSEMLKNFAN